MDHNVGVIWEIIILKYLLIIEVTRHCALVWAVRDFIPIC